MPRTWPTVACWTGTTTPNNPCRWTPSGWPGACAWRPGIWTQCCRTFLCARAKAGCMNVAARRLPSSSRCWPRTAPTVPRAGGPGKPWKPTPNRWVGGRWAPGWRRQPSPKATRNQEPETRNQNTPWPPKGRVGAHRPRRLLRPRAILSILPMRTIRAYVPTRSICPHRMRCHALRATTATRWPARCAS